MKNKLYLICILLCMLNSSYGQSQPSKESSFKMYGSGPTSLREQIDKSSQMNKQKFLIQFDIRVKQPIRNNPEMLYKNYWKNK